MTVRDASTRPNNPRRTHDERLKDEVYRHMFRLEGNRPGADLDLAVALVRGWLDANSRAWKARNARLAQEDLPDLPVHDRSQSTNERH